MRTLTIAPAELVRVFGVPDETDIPELSTGHYMFEDSNFDIFQIIEVR